MNLIMNRLPILDIIFAAIFAYLLIIGISFIGSILNSFISYFDFKIWKNNQTINISYGLFVKNSNSFHIDRIKAIKIKQSFIKRMFGFASIDVEVIGYGENNSNEKDKVHNVLIPLCKNTEVNNYIIQILGEEYLPLEMPNKARACFPLFSWVSLIVTISCFLPIVFVAIWTLYYNIPEVLIFVVGGLFIIWLIINIFVIINACLKYHHEGLGVSETKTCINHGGFATQTSIFLNHHIIGVEDITTPKRSKKGIYSYIIHFRGNAMNNELVVDILDEEVREKLLFAVRY